MQQGLHVGLACWIAAQVPDSGVPLLPGAAIPFRLPPPLATSAQDVMRGGELALMANRSFQPGGAWDAGPAEPRLWDRHRDILKQMVTASSTLTADERDRLAQAEAVLFDATLVPTRVYSEYLEYRRIYQDLVTSQAPESGVASALQDWDVQGHKSLVETALATRTLLTHTSSVLPAQQDVLRIESEKLSGGAEVPVASTYYSPVSASDPSLWLQAEADLDALEASIAPEVPRGAWTEFRALKSGVVRFRFAVVDLQRPWFTESLYAARDWKLPPEVESPVADGHGTGGLLPAFVSRIFLAQVLEVRTSPQAPPPPPVAQPLPVQVTGPFHPVFAAVAAHRRQPAAPARELAAPRPAALARPVTVSRGRDGGLVLGLPRSERAPVAVAAPSTSGLRPDLLTQRFQVRMHSLPAATIQGRLSLLDAVWPASQPVPLPPQPTGSETEATFVVGFGRTALPACPNPDPRYQWS